MRAMPITARRLRVLATRRVHFWTHDRGDCSNEVLGIVKIAIDARKTDVSDLIKFRQVTHYNVTHLRGGHFGLEICVDISFDILNNAFNDVAFDRAFGTGTLDSATDFLAVQWLSCFVGLDDPDAEAFDFLSSSKLPLT